MDYTCCFILLLTGNSSDDEIQQTINSIFDFAHHTFNDPKQRVHILCNCDETQDVNLPSLKQSQHIENVTILTKEQWNLPQNRFPLPPIVDLCQLALSPFGLRYAGQKDTTVIIDVGEKIDSHAYNILDKTLQTVSENRKQLVVSFKRNQKFIPASCAFRSPSVGWNNLLAASSRYSISCRKKLFSGIEFQASRTTLASNLDIPWLISAIAFDYQRDKNSSGYKVTFAQWT